MNESKRKSRKFILLAAGGLALLVGLVPFLFLSTSIRDSPELACAMEQVERNSVVVRELGAPIESGSPRLSYSERSGARYEARFTASVSGTIDDGRIRVEVYRAPAGSYLLVEYQGNEGWMTVYEGDYPCG